MTVLVPESWLKPQTLQDVLMKNAQMQELGSQQQTRQAQLQMQQRLMPLKEQLMKAQISKTMQPAQPNVWQQKMMALDEALKKQGIPDEQREIIKGRALLTDQLKLGGQQTSIQFPGGGGVSIGAQNVPTGGLNDVLKKFGIEQPAGEALTKPELTARQKIRRNIQTLLPQLENLKKGAKFQNLFTRLSAEAGGEMATVLPGIAKKLGITGEEAGQLASFYSDIEKSAEGMLNALNLRVTDKSLAAMKRVVAPRKNEPEKQYENRLNKEINELYDRYSTLSKGSTEGAPLDLQKPTTKQEVISYKDYF